MSNEPTNMTPKEIAEGLSHMERARVLSGSSALNEFARIKGWNSATRLDVYTIVAAENAAWVRENRAMKKSQETKKALNSVLATARFDERYSERLKSSSKS